MNRFGIEEAIATRKTIASVKQFKILWKFNENPFLKKSKIMVKCSPLAYMSAVCVGVCAEGGRTV